MGGVRNRNPAVLEVAHADPNNAQTTGAGPPGEDVMMGSQGVLKRATNRLAVKFYCGVFLKHPGE